VSTSESGTPETSEAFAATDDGMWLSMREMVEYKHQTPETSGAFAATS